jgi:hypothetical protein
MEKAFSQDLLRRQADIDRALVAHIEVETVRERNEPPQKREGIFKRIKTGQLSLRGLAKTLVGSVKLGNLRQRLGLIYGNYQYADQNAPSEYAEAELDLLAKILLQAKASVKAWGGKLYFVYLPDWTRYARPEIADKHRDRVLTLAKTVGLPVIDIHDAFRAHADPLALFPFRQPAHYNEEGHRVVADTVLRSISIAN